MAARLAPNYNEGDTYCHVKPASCRAKRPITMQNVERSAFFYALVWALVLALVLLAAMVSPGVPVAAAQEVEVQYGIGNHQFWDYYHKRGGVRTFGYPISREFTLQGFRVQLFQRGMLQLLPEGRVATMNLLDEGLMPYSSFNFSVVPSPDRELLESAPSPADPNYAEKAMEFLRANVPDRWDGMPVNFYATFLSTVRFEDAFPDGRGERGLLPLLNLELWGVPTSRPTYDPSNRGFVYQRFQRGIMHYDASSGATQGILLGEYLKGILTGKDLPLDLDKAASSSVFYRQYDPSAHVGPLRPAALPGSLLDGAFQPGWGDPRFGVVVAGAGNGDAGLVASTLSTLGAGSWYTFEKSDLRLKGRVELIRPGSDPSYLSDLSARAKSRPGAAWIVGNEPNVPGQDDMQPAAYADFLHQVTTTLKAADPTALIVGPNVLNWEKTCNGCPGYTAGRVWAEQMVAEYRGKYGPVPFDAWGVHTYSLDWDSLPLVNSDDDKAQLLAARRWLDSQGLKLPLWLTEFGVIWGFEGIDWVSHPGGWQARPVGSFREDLVGAYIDEMLTWLSRSGRSEGIERWFLYATAPPPEPYASRPAGIALLEPTGVVLTPLGERFRSIAKGE